MGLLRRLREARGASGHGLTAAQLCESLRADPLQVEPLLEWMVSLDWVGRLDEHGAARYLLLGDPASTPIRPLVSHLLLAPSGPVDAFWRRADLDGISLGEVLAPSEGA